MTRFAIALSMVVSSALWASAQDRVFVGSREVGAIGHFGDNLRPAPAFLHAPKLGGDRYVHIDTGILDLRTGATLPMPSGFLVAYDRARPRVYVGRSDGIWGVDVSNGQSILAIPGPVFDVTTCVHATSADILFCAFARPDGQRDIVRSGPLGAVPVATVRFADVFSEFWVVTPDASRLYLQHCSRTSGSAPAFSCAARDVAVVDVATGLVTTAGQLDALVPSPLVWDEVHDRLFAVGGRIDVFTRDLVPVGSADTGAGWTCRDLAISPHTGRLYLNLYNEHASTAYAMFSAYDAGSLRQLEPGRSRATSPGSGCAMTVLTAPGAPRDFRASVAGSSLTLTWTNIGGASGFVLDVGFAPGRSDLSLFLGPTPYATFSNVPPGTYYLRMRGGNLHGGGRPSREVEVTVR